MSHKSTGRIDSRLGRRLAKMPEDAGDVSLLQVTVRQVPRSKLHAFLAKGRSEVPEAEIPGPERYPG